MTAVPANPASRTVRAMPVLQVSDVRGSVAFYRRLGFATEGAWDGTDEDPGEVFFAIIQRGDVTLGLQLLRGPLRVNTHWAAYVYVTDAEALRAEFEAQGLEPTEMHRPEHYGCIDFDIVDPGPGLGTYRGRG